MTAPSTRILVAAVASALLLMSCASAGTEANREIAAADRVAEPTSAPPVARPTPTPVSTPLPTATVRPASTATPTPEALRSEPVRHDYGEDPAQYGWLRFPATDPDADELVPIVVLIHGGFWAEPWDYTLMTPMADALFEAGVATWNIEFRRLGGRGGWPGTFDDVSAAIVHLRDLATEYPIDLSRVVVAGHSSGGHLAMWAAAPAGAHAGLVPPARAVGIAPITDLRKFVRSTSFLGGTSETEPERWAFAQPSLDPAIVEIVHGVDDAIVPLTTIRNAVDAGVPVLELADTDHFEVIEPGPGLDAVVAAIIDAVART